jgi:hypothetical protein
MPEAKRAKTPVAETAPIHRTAAAAASGADPFADMIDELGGLEQQLAPFKTKIARVEALRKILRTEFGDINPTIAFERHGKRFALNIGPRGMERVIDEPKLIKRLGLKAFAAIAHVTLGALEKAVAPAIVADVVATEQTGPRRMSTYEIPKAA